MTSLEEAEVGDITPNGYEIVEINTKRVYKMRKRITINKDVYHKQYRGKSGWQYWDTSIGSRWFELDDFPDKQLRFRDIEVAY